MKTFKFYIIVVVMFLVSCRQSEHYYLEHSETIIVYDTIIMPNYHVHHPENPICLWGNVDTIPLCVELPYTIKIPVSKKKYRDGKKL